MAKIRITKEFHFEMAHALLNYDGLCSSIHGHSYSLSVTLIGEQINSINNPKNGMVIDFTLLKSIIKENIVDKLDHALLINAASSEKDNFKDSKLFERVIYTDYQPTCENLLSDFARKLENKFPSNIKLYSLKLKETSTSYAEWYASDNE